MKRSILLKQQGQQGALSQHFKPLICPVDSNIQTELKEEGDDYLLCKAWLSCVTRFPIWQMALRYFGSETSFSWVLGISCLQSSVKELTLGCVNSHLRSEVARIRHDAIFVSRLGRFLGIERLVFPSSYVGYCLSPSVSDMHGHFGRPY